MKKKDLVAKKIIKLLEDQKFPQGLTPPDALHQVTLIVEALALHTLKSEEFAQHVIGVGPHYPVYLLLQTAMEFRATEDKIAAGAIENAE